MAAVVTTLKDDHRVDTAHLEDNASVEIAVGRHRKVAVASVDGGQDKAAQFLAQAGRGVVAVTPADNARVRRKIDQRLLPIILFVYFLQSLDKSTLSYAAVFGLLDDARLVGTEFSWLSSAVYAAQLVFQPLVAYILVKVPIGRFASTMVLCWGVVLCAMAATTDFGGLMATRVLLGTFEASVGPTFIAIVQMWYRRREQTTRNAAWYAMLGIVTMFGSLLSYGLGHINSRLNSYQIIFLFCGCLTVVASIPMFYLMPNSPVDAKFLDQDEKVIAVERLRMNQAGIGSGVWKWDHVVEAFLDIKTYLWVFLILFHAGGLGTFGPLIIESFGFGRFTTILFVMPLGAVQVISTLSGAWLSNRFQSKSAVLALLCLPAIAGCTVLLVVGRGASNRAVLLMGFYLLSTYSGIAPLIYSWSGQNTAGDTKRKVTTAAIFIGSNTGNIVGPQLFKPSERPLYTRGLRASLAFFVALLVLNLAGAAWMWHLNKRQAKRRVAAQKRGHITDLSMVKSIGVQTAEVVGEHAFEDVTDLKNEDFIYVY